MRIGFDAKRAFANKTGLGNYSRFVLNSLLLNEQEHDYLAYTPKNTKSLFTGFPTENILEPESFLDKKLSALWRYSAVTNQLQKDKIDVFHGLSNEIPQGLAKAGMASVVTIHDLIFEKLPTHYKTIDRAIYRYKFKSACKRADSIIAISEQTRRDLIELYQIDQNKIEVIYQDCNPVFKRLVETEKRKEILELYGINDPYVLCVGTIEERKNQLKLTEAFCNLKNKDFKLVLIGKATPYLQKIKNFISKNKIENRVLILENVPTEHLPALYQEAAVFAYISIYEGFGIPILEALNSGTPVIAARGSCLEEAGGPGGLYADPFDVEEITFQLEKILADATLRESLVISGKSYVTKFTGNHIASQLVNLYNRLNEERRYH